MSTCLLFGTSVFALPTAEALRTTSACELLGVTTQSDAPAGRGRRPAAPPIKVWAESHGMRVWQPETQSELTVLLRELQPDIGVVAAYGRILPPTALGIPKFGFVNIHPSLLPRWRGPSPVAAAIAAGETETGVTIIQLDAEMDHGPILAQERVSLSPTATRSAVERALAHRGAALLARVLPDYLAGRMISTPQDHAQATTTPLLSREHGRIDWQEPAAVIERKVRAYEGWPGTWCTLPSGKRLKILRAEMGGLTPESPGNIAPSQDHLDVACGDHTLLSLVTVQPAGKPSMDGAAFRRGHEMVPFLS